MTIEELQKRMVFISSQIVCAQIEAQSMITANLEKQEHGQALAYDEDAFDEIAEYFGIDRESIVTFLND